jgi:hypothetical protein
MLHCRPGLTAVKIIDYSYVHYVNAEVEVLLPEESGIVQIEVLNCLCLTSIALACVSRNTHCQSLAWQWVLSATLPEESGIVQIEVPQS